METYWSQKSKIGMEEKHYVECDKTKFIILSSVNDQSSLSFMSLHQTFINETN